LKHHLSVMKCFFETMQKKSNFMAVGIKTDFALRKIEHVKSPSKQPIGPLLSFAWSRT